MADRAKVEGFVAFINEKRGESARGPWTAYSVKMVGADGVEDPRWYRFGFDAPSFKDDKSTGGNGDYVMFEADIKDGVSAQFVPGTGQLVKNPPDRTAPQRVKSGGGGGAPRRGGGGPKLTKSAMFGDIGGYNTEDDVRRISMSHAQEMAIDTVSLLLQHDGLPITGAKTKAGQAARFEEITAAIDKKTVEYFFDTASGRLLDSVADDGAEAEAKAAPLPADVEGEEVVEQGDKDVPPDPYEGASGF